MRGDRAGLVGLLVARGVSTLGTRMSFLALPWFVLVTTGSPTRTGLVAFAEMAPFVLVQAMGGPLVDRAGAWRVSILTDLAATLAVGLVPVLYAMDRLSFGALLALVAAAGAVRGAGDSARYVLLPGAVEASGTPMERATGLTDGVMRLAGMIGAPLAGVLIAATSAPLVIAIDAATFLASALAVLVLVPRSTQPAPVAAGVDGGLAPTGYWGSMAEGFRYLRADRLLLGIGVMVLVTNLVDQAGASVLLPVWSKEVTGSAVTLGLLSGALGLGAVLGNGVVTWLGHRLPRRATYAWCFLVAGAPRFFVMGLLSAVSPVLAISFLAGIGAGGINPILGAVEFERVPRHLQARVLGVLGALAWAGIPVGGLLGGLAVEQVGVRGASMIAGLVYLLATLAPFVFPAGRGMDRPATAEEPVPEGVGHVGAGGPSGTA